LVENESRTLIFLQSIIFLNDKGFQSVFLGILQISVKFNILMATKYDYQINSKIIECEKFILWLLNFVKKFGLTPDKLEMI